MSVYRQRIIGWNAPTPSKLEPAVNSGYTANVRRVKRKWLGVAGLILTLGSLLYWSLPTAPFPVDETLIGTVSRELIKKINSQLPAVKVGLMQKLFSKCRDFKSRLWPNANKTSFRPSEVQRCSIYGLLNQCMEVSGTQYLIEKKVATGNVMFGHTNVLNGQQWVQAFEHALQNNSPKWIDTESNEPRSENLVLLRYNKRTVLVLTPATAQKYREKYPKLTPLER